jgi:hypothetical protein
MFLIKISVELSVVAGRSRTRAGSPQAVSRRPCCAVALRRTAWSEHGWARHGHGMTSVNQTGPRCVNQMGKTHSIPLAARHGRETAWARHAMCESPFNDSLPTFRLKIPPTKNHSLQYTVRLRVRYERCRTASLNHIFFASECLKSCDTY